MKNHEITAVTAPQVVPVVYVDIVIPAGHPGGPPENSTDAFPGVMSKQLTARGPGHEPVYRVEGPLPQLMAWVLAVYCGSDLDSAVGVLAGAKLAM